MKFKLPRQLLDPEIVSIISREIRRQKISVTRASEKRLRELIQISHWIEDKGLPDFLVCLKLSHRLGFGIFLRADAKPIVKDQMIAPYSGEVSLVVEHEPDDTAYAFSPMDPFHLTKKEQAILDRGHRYHPRRLYSIKVDALYRGNFTRFINHSEEPNVLACAFCTTKKNSFGLPSMPIEIIYVAKKTIHPGEQLLVCYEEEEKSYWGAFNKTPFSMTPTTFRENTSLQILRERVDQTKPRGKSKRRNHKTR